MAQLTVGLDLGCETIKRVRLRSSFRTVEVVDFTAVEVPQDDRPRIQRMAEALGHLQESNNPNDLVASALPGDEISLRLLKMPFADPKKITQTIGFELESQIPFPLDQVVFDYLPAGKTDDGGSHQLVALCQIERMASWLETLKLHGIDPRLIGSDNLAYSSLIEVLPSINEEGATAVLDIGHRLTSLCIVGPAGVEFARTLTGGGLEITAQLATAFKVNQSRAEQGKRRSGFIESAQRTASSPEQVMISDTVLKAIASLIREVRQSLSAHHSLVRRPVSKIWLCGGGSAVTNFDDYLSQELGVEVERIRRDHFDLPGMQDISQDSESNAWAKSLGLALHAHHGGRHGWLNLRRGPFSFKGDFEYLRGKALHVAVVVLIIFILAVGLGITRYLSLSSTNDSLDQRMQETSKKILGRIYPDPDVIISIMREKVSPEADPLPRVTAIDVLRELHERVPEDFKVRYKDVNISPKKIRVNGFTDSFDSVEKIKSALEGYNCFTDIQTGKTQKTLDGAEVEFRFTIAFGC